MDGWFFWMKITNTDKSQIINGNQRHDKDLLQLFDELPMESEQDLCCQTLEEKTVLQYDYEEITQSSQKRIITHLQTFSATLSNKSKNFKCSIVLHQNCLQKGIILRLFLNSPIKTPHGILNKQFQLPRAFRVNSQPGVEHRRQNE